MYTILEEARIDESREIHIGEWELSYHIPFTLWSYQLRIAVRPRIDRHRLVGRKNAEKIKQPFSPSFQICHQVIFNPRIRKDVSDKIKYLIQLIERPQLLRSTSPNLVGTAKAGTK